MFSERKNLEEREQALAPQRGGPRTRGLFCLKLIDGLRLHASACYCAGARHRARALIVYKMYPLKTVGRLKKQKRSAAL